MLSQVCLATIRINREHQDPRPSLHPSHVWEALPKWPDVAATPAIRQPLVDE